jgi:hypothetical protein
MGADMSTHPILPRLSAKLAEWKDKYEQHEGICDATGRLNLSAEHIPIPLLLRALEESLSALEFYANCGLASEGQDWDAKDGSVTYRGKTARNALINMRTRRSR